jgi:hypothetical protein
MVIFSSVIMSFHRVIKKSSYAAIFLILLFGAVYALFSWFSTPNSQKTEIVPTPPPIFQPLETKSVHYIQSSDSVDAVIQLKNPNVRAGVANLPITFKFKDSRDQVVAESTTNAYILPGSTQYVATFNVPVTVPITSVIPILPENPVFTPISDSFQLPRFSTIMRDRTIRTIANQPFEEQKGLVGNNNPFVFRTVDIIVIGFNSEGEIVGLGQTSVGDLEIGEQREFTVQWLLPSQSVERVIAIPTTNIFLKDNIREIKRDPSLLD